LLDTATIDAASLFSAYGGPVAPQAAWHALWTRSHCEQLVHDHLLQKGYQAFLPTVSRWSVRRGKRQVVRQPMFPSYLFVREAMGKAAYLEVVRVRGVVRVLGDRWDRLATIPDDEIAAIERLSSTQQPVECFPYLTEGEKVRIATGPLAGIEGIFVKARPRQQLLVLSVHLLQRSVAVVVDSHEVVPA
jgi:transcription antitermination factor NusG